MTTPAPATGDPHESGGPSGQATPVVHDVLGTPVTMPVEIRHARCFVAGFTADAPQVARLANPLPEPTGNLGGPGRAGPAPSHTTRPHLRPLEIRPARSMCMIVFIDYVDGDLGPYNEFGVCFLMEDPDSPASSTMSALRSLFRGDARALIHRLPVDGEFTKAAGRGIWGFPKTLADFTVDHHSHPRRGRVEADGQLIVDLSVAKGLPVPDNDLDTVLRAYSDLDGTLRETPWRLTSTKGTRTRLGGATLTLGSHPIAYELRMLRMSRRALMTSSIDTLTMRFEDAQVLG